MVKIECIKRMKMLGMSSQCIKAFQRGEIWESEGIGSLYELNDEEKKIVEKFENDNPGYVVYHLIHNMLEFGECYALLFVGPDESEWAMEIEDLKEGYAFSYVYNKDCEWCSEFGSIVIRPNIGGLIRIG